ncbi:MAG TPA: ABC transporter permease [Desulfuromonadales bacterium]|nr:ABC transporter permease [Desulfuromonadales bacterium]
MRENRDAIRNPSLMRLRGLMRKEIWQIVRDPSSIAIAFVMPLLLLLIHGYGVSLDAKHVPVALVVDRPSSLTASFTSGFDQSEYFSPRRFDSIAQAEDALVRREVDALVWLRGNFEELVRTGKTAPVGVFVNGVDANNARLISGYIEGVWSRWLERYAEQRGVGLTRPINLQERIWFNPGMRSRDYLVPGIIAVIMTLIGALLTSLLVAREWERGTMEALLVTPVRIREILMGKLIPYFALGMGGMIFSVAMGVWLFQVPLRGSLLVLLGTSALFLLTALGMGLLISTVARNQFVAGQTAIIATFLPAFILSGFIFDIASMPAPIRTLTYVLPARYYVSILQTVFLAGDVPSVILWNTAALALMALFFLLAVRLRTHKRLD